MISYSWSAWYTGGTKKDKGNLRVLVQGNLERQQGTIMPRYAAEVSRVREHIWSYPVQTWSPGSKEFPNYVKTVLRKGIGVRDDQNYGQYC